jgi:hypothetical protein
MICSAGPRQALRATPQPGDKNPAREKTKAPMLKHRDFLVKALIRSSSIIFKLFYTSFSKVIISFFTNSINALIFSGAKLNSSPAIL